MPSHGRTRDSASLRGRPTESSVKNWLLVGVAQFDLVAAITGASFGETNTISTIIYVLVGLSAIALLPVLFRWLTGSDEPAA